MCIWKCEGLTKLKACLKDFPLQRQYFLGTLLEEHDIGKFSWVHHYFPEYFVLCIPRAMCSGGNCMKQGSYTCTQYTYMPKMYT